MKRFFLVMLLLNTAAFGWVVWFADGEEEPIVSALAGDLQLLTEHAQAAGATAHCFLLGPVAERRLAQRYREALERQGLLPLLQEQEQHEPVGYWVFLPPAASLDRAQSMANRLAERGVTDFVLVVGPHRTNAISLGLYQDSALAQARVGQLELLGFSPRLEQRHIARTTYQLEVALAAGRPPELSALHRWRQIDCQPRRD